MPYITADRHMKLQDSVLARVDDSLRRGFYIRFLK